MAEVHPTTMFTVTFTTAEYRLVMKALALTAGIIKRVDPEERGEAARLNVQLLENQRSHLAEQLAVASAALEKAENNLPTVEGQ